MSATAFIETGSSKVSKKSARKYEANEFYADKSIRKLVNRLKEKDGT